MRNFYRRISNRNEGECRKEMLRLGVGTRLPSRSNAAFRRRPFGACKKSERFFLLSGVLMLLSEASKIKFAWLAQSVEQLTLNQLVRGSSPRPGTTLKSLITMRVMRLFAFSGVDKFLQIYAPNESFLSLFPSNSLTFLPFLSTICLQFFPLGDKTSTLLLLQKATFVKKDK